MNKIATFLLLLTGFITQAQEYIPVDTITTHEVKQISFDLEGNLYVLSGNTLTRYPDKPGKPAHYSSPLNVESFYIASKWKIYLFSDDQFQILNNQLAPVNDIFQIEEKIVAADVNNYLWKLDANSKLIKFDPVTSQETLIIQLKEIPKRVIIHNNIIYIQTDNEISLYNDFGSRTDILESGNSILLAGPQDIFRLKDTTLTRLKSKQSFNLPIHAELVALGQDKIAILRDGKVFIFIIKK